jgi:hypothetical protein
MSSHWHFPIGRSSNNRTTSETRHDFTLRGFFFSCLLFLFVALFTLQVMIQSFQSFCFDISLVVFVYLSLFLSLFDLTARQHIVPGMNLPMMRFDIVASYRLS